MQISISMTKRFLYGLRIRPYSIGAQPKDPVEYIDNEHIPKDVKENFTETDYRFGILVYDEPLSDRDIDHYSLTNMNLISDKEAWTKFVELATQVKKEYDLSLEDFIAYYIRPKGDYADQNPLYKGLVPKSNVVFDFLSKHGYQGSPKGLANFYEKL